MDQDIVERYRETRDDLYRLEFSQLVSFSLYHVCICITICLFGLRAFGFQVDRLVKAASSFNFSFFLLRVDR